MQRYPRYLKNKIFTIDELKKKLSSDYKEKKIAVCHGTFDIVHPGHIRHLIYAKQKTDILIASVTADKYVVKTKGEGPFIPEELRARNLAALEMVDFVVIDNNEKPLKMISKIRPNYFVKGFEYSLDNIYPNTREEMRVLEKHGGKLLFSPGDIVYSSRKLQKIKKPKITYEKILALLDSEKLNFLDIKKTLNKFKNTSVHVVGDLIVDKYNYCSILGQTTKTPTFSIKKNFEEIFVGGAGVVAKHLKNLGAKVTLTTILGDDELNKFVIKDLKSHGIKCNFIIDTTRCTTLKERFWAENYKLIQVDNVDNHPISEKTVKQISKYIKINKSKAIIFSDFRHGIFNKESIKSFTKYISKNVVKIADSQVSNRWGNILDFKNFDLVLPNEKEARFALADQDSGVRLLGTNLFKQSKTKYLILKLGERGLIAYRNSASHPRDFFPIDSFVEELIDTVGAGDALLAASSLAFINTKNILISAVLGNICASILCERSGNTSVNLKQLVEKLDKITKDSLI